MSSSSAAAAMTDELEATRQKKRRKKHRERAEVAEASSESPRTPATPDSMLESPAPTAPETLTSTAAAAASPLVEEAVRKEERKKHKRSRYQEEAATPSPSAPATAAQILEIAAARKEQRRGKVEKGQSCQGLLPVDVNPQGGVAAAAADAGVSVSQSVKRRRGGKIPVLSDHEILRIRRNESKPMPESFVPAMVPPNPIDQDSKYSSSFGPFFDQFCYKPDRQEGRNALSLPKTPDRPARPLPQDHPPSLSSQLTANETFMAAKTTTLNTKQPRSASVSHLQEEAAAAADAGVSVSQSVKRCCGGKIPVPSDRKILRTRRIELGKQQPMPKSSVPAMANPNPFDQDFKYSSPLGPFFDQFCYKPDRQEGRNAPSLPKTPDRPARPLPRDHLPSLSSQLTANETFMTAKTTISNTKQPHSASVSLLQEEAAAAADAGVSVSQSVKRCHSGKVPVPSDRKILRTRRIESRKQQPMPKSFVPAKPNPNPIRQDSKYSSPFGPFFDQFCYKPDRQEARNALSLPKTPDCPARPLPQDHQPSLSSHITANETFMAAKTTTSDAKQPRSASLLSAAEKRSDKYRRLPLNQLVCPPRSKYNLMQEKYASDPWKVIVICILLNATTGNQVKRKLEGFFERYPDAQTAYTADPEKMAKYLAPLGLQRVKTKRIQRFSKAYVEEEWTYITELYGVGKYAADAYAIFCAGRATEVVPEDHMLVVYWKFVCKLRSTQAWQNEQEAVGATRL